MDFQFGDFGLTFNLLLLDEKNRSFAFFISYFSVNTEIHIVLYEKFNKLDA